MQLHIIAIFWYLYLLLLFLILIGLSLIGMSGRKGEEGGQKYAGKVLVIVPCRGVDYSLEENLQSISSQDYENYDVVAVVDDENDPSVEIIKRIGLKFLISSFPCRKCSGKVRAISTALEKHPGYDAFVISDSDITVDRTWLSSLVSPLSDSSVGLSTSFPYFNPVAGIWSKVKSIWGFVGQAMMESNLTRFGWGGSLAFRSDFLDSGSFGSFSESVSDDTALTKICKRKRLELYYSKRSEPIINSPDDFTAFFEWANRQTALSISATRRVFYYGLLFYLSSILLFISAIALSVLSSPFFAIFFVPTIISEIKNLQRSKRKFFSIVFIVPFIPFLYLLNLLIASRMEAITWRGNTYMLQKSE